MQIKTHHLKTWPAYFQAVLDGIKTFEARMDDRGFKVGDCLCLQEYNPDIKEYTGREVTKEITYILNGREFGVEYKFCVMALSRTVFL